MTVDVENLVPEAFYQSSLVGAWAGDAYMPLRTGGAATHCLSLLCAMRSGACSATRALFCFGWWQTMRWNGEGGRCSRLSGMMDNG
jgi:hypothetical protein